MRRPTVIAGLIVTLLGMAACERGRAADDTASGTPAANTTAAKPADMASGDRADAAKSPAAPRAVTIPAGTRLPIVLDTPVGSATSRVEEPVRAHLARAVSQDGVVVLPERSVVSGVVTNAKPSGKVKGRAQVAVRFDAITPGGGERYAIQTAAVGRTAPATKKKDALEIGGPAAGGALVGAILGGKKGALIGTAAGGGAGTAVVLSTSGREVRIPEGAALTLQLSAPVTVTVPRP
jgi:hypothetical protein